MIRIRMQRRGRTHRPFFRIGAMDARERRDGNMVEHLGWFNPMEPDESRQLSIKTERIQHWLDAGAQPSPSVRDLLGKHELLPQKMRAEWEADRKRDRDRLACKQLAARVDAAANELTELSESAASDLTEHLSRIKSARRTLKRSISRAHPPWAEQAATEAEQALADAKAAEAAAKPAVEEAAAEAESETAQS